MIRNLDDMQVSLGVKTALRKDVNEDGKRLGIVEKLVLRVDVCAARNGVPDDDWHHLPFDEFNHRLHQLRLFDFVVVEAAHESWRA